MELQEMQLKLRPSTSPRIQTANMRRVRALLHFVLIPEPQAPPIIHHESPSALPSPQVARKL